MRRSGGWRPGSSRPTTLSIAATLVWLVLGYAFYSWVYAAPLAMPVLVGLGAVSWWQFAASFVTSLACTVGVARLAVSVYRRAILQSGRRVRLREALAR